MARNDKDDRTSVSRSFFIGNGSHCAVHLINSGLSIYGDNAKVEFATSGLPTTGTMCIVDSQQFPCKFFKVLSPIKLLLILYNFFLLAGENPLVLNDLEEGRHRVSITPVCEGTAVPYLRAFFVE